MKKTVLTILPLCLLLSACEGAPDTTDSSAQESVSSQRIDWPEFREQFIESYFKYNPVSAIAAGQHEYDGQLHDYSPEAVAKEIAWLNEQRSAAGEYTADELPGRAAFEHDYLIAAIDQMLFDLDVSEFLKNNPVAYAFQTNPSIYLSLEYAPLAERMAAFATYAENLPAYLAQMKANLKTPLARTHVEVTKGILGGTATFFESAVPGIFVEVDDAALQERLAAANATAIGALNETVVWLDAQEVDDNYALGEERFLTMLRMNEGVDLTLEELKAAGEADLERNLALLQKACDVYAPGDSLSDCVAKTETLKTEGGPVAGAQRQLAGLKQFLIDEDIVSIPGTEEALVDEAPPYARFNIAYINIPGPYEKGLPSTYYIAPPDPSWSEQDQLDYLPGRKNLLYITVHEVWPGHFLNFLHANRAESKFGQLFFTYSFVEGWAHYTEQMMYDAGLDNGDPESHIGQLKNALIRNVRFLSAIGLHTGNMTVDVSRAMFEEMAFQDPGNASQQANRGTFDPGYLNYTLGKLMINKLRDDWTADRGGREAWKEFHDTFLSYGGPPIPMVRADMLDEDYAGDRAPLPH